MKTCKLTKANTVVLCFLSLAGLATSPGVFGQSLEAVPTTPEFTEYLDRVQAAQWPPTDQERNYGLIPLPVDLSHLQQQATNLPRPSLTFPSAYDLRVLGRVTPVRDQNPYGTCWAFATFGSLESGLLPMDSADFSENNLVNLAGFDWSFNFGGNALMSTAYLVRWGGPVSETDDPYPKPGDSPTGLTVRKHIQQVRILPAKAGPILNDAIKQALMDSGAIYVSYYHSGIYYSPTYQTYCYPAPLSSHNHAVTLVGWDDNFDRTKFISVPAGNGAYIVKNSWGTGWGENGYYYVSYYDNNFAHATMFAFLNAEPVANYLRVYSYDPLGWVTDVGVSTTTLWAANLFSAAATEKLGAVGFYANSVNTSYAVYIYTGVSAGAPRSGILAATKTGTNAYPGYCTISLDSPVPLTAGQRFSIVLALTTPGYNYPQPIEYYEAGYSSAATAAPGQSYWSASGSTWTDLTTFDSTANFCIKGYSVNPQPRLTLACSAGMLTLTWPAGSVLLQADDVVGPYTEVVDAVSPYTTAAGGPQKYYRLRYTMP